MYISNYISEQFGEGEGGKSNRSSLVENANFMEADNEQNDLMVDPN